MIIADSAAATALCRHPLRRLHLHRQQPWQILLDHSRRPRHIFPHRCPVSSVTRSTPPTPMGRIFWTAPCRSEDLTYRSAEIPRHWCNENDLPPTRLKLPVPSRVLSILNPTAFSHLMYCLTTPIANRNVQHQCERLIVARFYPLMEGAQLATWNTTS